MEKTVEKYYQSLYEVAAVMNSARAPEAVLQSIVESITKTMGAKGSSLMLLTPDKKLLLHTVACGLSDWYVRKGPVSADKSIAEALEGKVVPVLHAATDDRVQYREQAEKEGIASIISIPMQLREEVIGVIRVYTAEPYEFTLDDMYFMAVVANLGAIALENARLYETVQKDYDTFRRDMLEWRAALGDEWMIQESVVPAEEVPKRVEPG
ncbi:GAF domain-containing protein [Chloroflexota bacterium]